MPKLESESDLEKQDADETQLTETLRYKWIIHSRLED